MPEKKKTQKKPGIKSPGKTKRVKSVNSKERKKGKKRRSGITTKKEIQNKLTVTRIVLTLSVFILGGLLLFVLYYTDKNTGSSWFNGNSAETRPSAPSSNNSGVQNGKYPETGFPDTNEGNETGKDIHGVKQAIVLILDDAGYNLEQIRVLDNLKYRMNISIIPGLPHSTEVYNLIRNSSFLFPMLHIPMEPKNQSLDDYPEQQKKDFITLNDTAETIDLKISSFLSALPVKYANNHMGSLISESETYTKLVLAVLQAKGIGFIDSKTSSDSLFESSAKTLDIKIFENRIFLDNENNIDYIWNRFNSALEEKNPLFPLIMIGHVTKSQTILFLKQLRGSEIFETLNFLTVEDLFHKYSN